jgi:uncharacterized protein YaaR (DUF327 family)
MEPIRPDRSRPSSRRTSRSRTGESDSRDGAFLRRIADLDTPSGVDEPAPAGGILESPSLPEGVDAPTEKLYDEVHRAGQRLLNEKTYSAAQAYREAIQLFLRKVMPEANTIEIRESGHGILSRKRYYLLTEINRSVDRLVSGVLQTQHRQLDVLRRLEEIQGMLIDLLH